VIGIVIVAHGGLAREYLAAMEHVIGKQDGAVAISISAECDREERRQAIFKAVEDVDCGYGVVVVTDIFGGTPSNLALAAWLANILTVPIRSSQKQVRQTHEPRASRS